MKDTYIKSPLNYTGGKYKLLPQIMPLFPETPNTFVDIFCGGANVGINSHAKHVVYNDNSEFLANLYKTFDECEYESLVLEIEKTIEKYGLSNSLKNGYDYYSCNSADGLGGFNKTAYIRLRQEFNSLGIQDNNYYIMLFVLIIFGFNNQIRFNSKGQFNLPVGKRDFNSNIRKNLKLFIERLKKQEKEFSSVDFRTFDISKLKKNDFVYCDPPYLITTASYNEMNGWTSQDEEDLLVFLDKLNSKRILFALSNVTHHKGRTNELLLNWAEKYNIHYLSFNYNNSNYHSKNTEKITQEVLITNY